MKELDCLKNMLYNEVDKINSQGELTPTTLEIADTVIDIIKDIIDITQKEEQMGGYIEEGSYRNGYNNRMYPSYDYYDNSYNNGSGSYNGRPRNNNNNYNNYGYDNGYSRHTATDQMIDKLEIMMQDATSKDKSVIQHCIDELKKH